MSSRKASKRESSAKLDAVLDGVRAFNEAAGPEGKRTESPCSERITADRLLAFVQPVSTMRWKCCGGATARSGSRSATSVPG